MINIKVLEILDTQFGKMTWETFYNIGLTNARLNKNNNFLLGNDIANSCTVELVNDPDLACNTLYVSNYIKELIYPNRDTLNFDDFTHRPLGSIEH